jgi:hypothetical protein
MSKLMLHSGAQNVTLEDVLAVTTPEATDTWHPIPHGELVEAVRDTLQGVGLGIQGEEYGLWGDEGEMMFGVMKLKGGTDDFAPTVGIRNAHNKRFAAGIAGGSHVFVCDNMAFSGEIRVNRKHTRHARADLLRLMAEALGRLTAQWRNQEARYELYKQRGLTDMEVHDLLVRMVDAKIIPITYLPRVLKEYRAPRHDEFEDRTIWTLHNATTEQLKSTHPMDLTDRTSRLGGLLDSVVAATESRAFVDELIIGGEKVTPAEIQQVLHYVPA